MGAIIMSIDKICMLPITIVFDCQVYCSVCQYPHNISHNSWRYPNLEDVVATVTTAGIEFWIADYQPSMRLSLGASVTIMALLINEPFRSF